MTGKERAALRAQANGLDVLFQVGKGGISDNLIEQTDGALRTKELIKLRVLTESSPVSAREAADDIAAKTSAEVIQVIGGVIVLYRYNPKLHETKKAVVKKSAPSEKKKSRTARSAYGENKTENGRKPAGAGKPRGLRARAKDEQPKYRVSRKSK